MTNKIAQSAQESTHFGFRTVDTADKAGLVSAVFSSVASRYDLMNDLMSVGMHRLWKAAMIDWLRPRPDMSLIDVGGGTGDIAFRFRRHGGGRAVVSDINQAMLAVGRDRAIDRGLFDGIGWVPADAEALPFSDQSFDAFTTAFCIRNVTHIDRVLGEARRVLKPGGRFLCLEFSRVVLPPLERAYESYSFRVLPALGQLVAGDRAAYRYLAESIRRFPDQKQFAKIIADSGFGNIDYRSLSGGIVALHSAWRI